MQQTGLDMDIRKWLAETEHSVPAEQPSIVPFPLPRRPDHAPDARRRRKRSSSDSSLLTAPSPQPRRRGLPETKRDHRAVRDQVHGAHRETSRSTRSESTDHCSASKDYARKPRHKTRPDRYEARLYKPMEQDERQRPNQKSKTRKSKYMSKRRKGDKTHNGIGQDFQASNVSKDRLTVSAVHIWYCLEYADTDRSSSSRWRRWGFSAKAEVQQ